MLPLAIRKFAFIGFFIPSTLTLLPLWTLSSLLASQRPDPHGPLSRALMTYLTRHILRCLTIFRVPALTPLVRSPPSIEENRKRKRGPFILIPHIGAEVLHGPLALEEKAGKGTFETGLLTTEMQKEPFGAFWYPASDSLELRGPSSKMILYFHGGAYVALRASEGDMDVGTRRMSKTVDVDILTLEYTTAAEDDPATRFPRILYEAYCTWKHVTKDLGYAPSNVYLAGDSAGANLAIILALYITKYDSAAGVPVGLILYSAWVDLTFSSPSFTANQGVCIVPPSFSRWGVVGLTQDHPLLKESVATSPWLSPVAMNKEDAAKFPRTYLSSGSHEILVDQIRAMRDVFQGANVDVTYDEGPCLPHDYQLLAPFLVEAQNLNKRIKAWMNQV